MAKSGVGTRTWRKTRERILRRDGFICQYCGQEADTVDHIIPFSKGGSHTWDNVRNCCLKCNITKHDRIY